MAEQIRRCLSVEPATKESTQADRLYPVETAGGDTLSDLTLAGKSSDHLSPAAPSLHTGDIHMESAPFSHQRMEMKRVREWRLLSRLLQR